MLNHFRLRKELSVVKERLRPPQLPDFDAWTALPLVSIVVAAWNEEKNIDAFLRSYSDLDYPHKELILVAGGEDQTWRRIQNGIGDQAVLVEQQAGEGKFNALKRGFQHTSGSVCFLTDADCVLNSESFKRVIYPIATGTESAVTGPTRPLAHQMAGAFVRAQAVNLFRKMRLVPDTHVSFLIGANCALESTLLRACMANSPDQAIGEDYFLALSIGNSGHKIFYECRSEIETHFPASFREYVQQKSRWHRGHLLLNFQFGDKRWVANTLTAIWHQALLAMPLLLLVPGFVGGLIWLLSWCILFIPYMKAKILTGQLGRPANSSILSLFGLMLADWSAWAVCLPQVFISRWRNSW